MRCAISQGTRYECTPYILLRRACVLARMHTHSSLRAHRRPPWWRVGGCTFIAHPSRTEPNEQQQKHACASVRAFGGAITARTLCWRVLAAQRCDGGGGLSRGGVVHCSGLMLPARFQLLSPAQYTRSGGCRVSHSMLRVRVTRSWRKGHIRTIYQLECSKCDLIKG